VWSRAPLLNFGLGLLWPGFMAAFGTWSSWASRSRASRSSSRRSSSLAARLIPLNSVYVPLPSDPLVGTETPDVVSSLPAADQSFTARRAGDVYEADNGRSYRPWDGRPRHFDHAD
jgi:hypothetical protein